MTLNLEIEIFTLILLFLILICFYNRKNIPSMQNVVFGIMIFVTFATVIISIAFIRIQSSFVVHPHFLIYIVSTLYYIVKFLFPVIFLVYLFVFCKRFKVCLCSLSIVLSLYIIYVLFLLINPFFHVFFSIGKNSLNYTALFSYTKYIPVLYGIACFIFVILSLKRLSFISIFAGLFQSVVLLLIHFTHEYVSFSYALTLILIIFSLQNPATFIDTSTKTYNRKAFDYFLDQKIKKQNAHFFIITVALDNFKIINQSFGIENGTRILRSVSDFLTTLKSDTKPFRYYADSFSLFIDDSETMKKIIAQIVSRFKDTWYLDDIVASLSATTIVTEFPKYASTTNEAALLIDFSLQEAKKSEKGQVFFCDNIIKEKMERVKDVEIAIARGLQNDSFEAYFQPIFSLEKDSFVSAESLARLYDEELGYISPEEFITIAEGNGTINQIGKRIFEKTCDFISKNNPRNYGINTVSVNLSVIQCMQKGFIDTLESVVSQYKIPKDMLHFEITETTKTNSMGFFNTFLRQMNEHGFALHLDDYGSGYSTLSYLTTLPFDTVKIDRSIIWDALDNEKSRKIVSNTINMLNELEFSIIAEGVENEDQVNMLKKMGCHYIQGYYCCVPLSANDFITFLSNNK